MEIASKPEPVAKPAGTGLVAKLAWVMVGIKHVPKRGHNSFHNYDYATEADIADAVREGLAEQGVMIVPSVDKLEWREVETKNGKASIATLHVRFTVTDGPEKIEFVMIGEGQDSGDKAVYKAMTGAQKYMLLKLFLISTGDDPEADDKAEPAPKRSAEPQPRKPDSGPFGPPSAQAHKPPAREPGDDDAGEPAPTSPKGGMIPQCPHCKSSKAVIASKFNAGEWCCWEKSTRGKGCGVKFRTTEPA